MKKILFCVLISSLLLSGCGQAPVQENSAVSQPDSEISEFSEVQTSEIINNSDEIIQTTVTETIPESTIPETIPPTEPQTEIPTESVTEKEISREEVIAAYQIALQDCIDKVSARTSDTYISMDYALYDMDYDSIKELIVKYGTCEADYMIAIYTYKNHKLVQIADELHGGHVSFGYDYVANQVVLCEGHMNIGNMTWYGIDHSGHLEFLIDTGEFEYSIDDNPEFDWYMKKYNVAYLDFASFFTAFTTNDESETHIYTFMDDTQEVTTEEFTGFDTTFLERNI